MGQPTQPSAVVGVAAAISPVALGGSAGAGLTSPTGATGVAPISAVDLQEDSDADEEDKQKPKCFNCGIPCHVTHATPKGQMCGTCHQYFTRTGRVRPTTGPTTRKDGSKSRSSHSSIFGRDANRPPRGMYVNHDDLVALATGPTSQGEALLVSMDREIVSYKRVVQNNKQYLSLLHRRVRDRQIAANHPYKRPGKKEEREEEADTKESKINGKWSNEELLLGVQGE